MNTPTKNKPEVRSVAKIDYIIEPGEVGTGFEFESKVTGGNVREFWPAVKKGFELCIEEGVLSPRARYEGDFNGWHTMRLIHPPLLLRQRRKRI